MSKHINTIEAWLRRQSPSDNRNAQGNILRRVFMPTERYLVDFAEGFTAEGWLQYDTDQDAHYFGCWVNPKKLLVVSYAEGDWCLVECSDVNRYNAEIEAMNTFYGEGYICKTIDTKTAALTTYHQDRAEFLIRKKG